MEREVGRAGRRRGLQSDREKYQGGTNMFGCAFAATCLRDSVLGCVQLGAYIEPFGIQVQPYLYNNNPIGVQNAPIGTSCTSCPTPTINIALAACQLCNACVLAHTNIKTRDKIWDGWQKNGRDEPRVKQRSNLQCSALRYS